MFPSVSPLLNLLLSVCSRVKELKRAREHETPQKSPLTMWYRSPDWFFCSYPRHFQEKRLKKTKTNIRTAIITISAVLLVRLLLHVQQHFSHIYSFHWLESGQRVTMTTEQRQRSGWGGGLGQNICFAAFFALFHGLLCRFSNMKRFLNAEGSECGRHLRRYVTSEDPQSQERSSRRTGIHTGTLWAQIPLHIFLSDQSIHFFLFCFVVFLNAK